MILVDSQSKSNLYDWVVMYMASITDKIELFINELMNNSNSIQIKRNELANLFNCAPSQINYVLMTRFTIDRGYYIDSKKGGGEYMKGLVKR